jgi:hypothetical protein
VGRIEDRELLDDLGVVHRRMPGDRPAPVMPGDAGTRLAPLLDQLGDVDRERVEREPAFDGRVAQRDDGLGAVGVSGEGHMGKV